MAKTRKELVYIEIRRIAKELDCDQQFLDSFDACYSFMYDSIQDLQVLKQIEITVKAMTLGIKTAGVKMDRLIAYALKPRLLPESF